MIWKMPEWMNEFLDYLPSMGHCSQKEQKKRIIAAMNLYPGDSLYDENDLLYTLVHKHVGLLQMLYNDRRLDMNADEYIFENSVLKKKIKQLEAGKLSEAP